MGQRRKTGGRQKGTPNKITATVKEAIEAAFNEVGGSKYLENVAFNDPKAFCALLGRILPKDVTVGGNPDAPHKLVVEILDPTKGDG